MKLWGTLVRLGGELFVLVSFGGTFCSNFYEPVERRLIVKCQQRQSALRLTEVYFNTKDSLFSSRRRDALRPPQHVSASFWDSADFCSCCVSSLHRLRLWSSHLSLTLTAPICFLLSASRSWFMKFNYSQLWFLCLIVGGDPSPLCSDN